MIPEGNPTPLCCVLTLRRAPLWIPPRTKQLGSPAEVALKALAGADAGKAAEPSAVELLGCLGCAAVVLVLSGMLKSLMSCDSCCFWTRRSLIGPDGVALRDALEARDPRLQGAYPSRGL